MKQVEMNLMQTSQPFMLALYSQPPHTSLEASCYKIYICKDTGSSPSYNRKHVSTRVEGTFTSVETQHAPPNESEKMTVCR